MQIWTGRYTITEHTGHGDLDAVNGLTSSFRGPSSLRGSYRKGRGEGGNKRKEEVQDFLWTLLIVLSPYSFLDPDRNQVTNAVDSSTDYAYHEIKSSTSGGKVSSAQTRAQLEIMPLSVKQRMKKNLIVVDIHHYSSILKENSEIVEHKNAPVLLFVLFLVCYVWGEEVAVRRLTSLQQTEV